MHDSYSGSLCLWSDRIWFNSMDTVYSMNIDGSDIVTEFTHKAGKEQSCIQGFQIIDGVLNISILTLDRDTYDISTSEVELSYPAPHTHEYEAVQIAATCEEGGYTQKTCSCGITYQIDRKDPKGHVLTESADGSRKECKNCDYALEETPPTTVPATVPTEPLPTETKPAPGNAGESGFLVPGIIVCAVLIPLVITGIVLLIGRNKKRKQHS